MRTKWALPDEQEEIIGRQGNRIVELEEEVAKLKYSNGGFANIYHDMKQKVAESERRRVELVEAVRPVAKAWNGWKAWLRDSDEEIDELKRISFVGVPIRADGASVAQLNALAALAGEEGK